MLERLETGDWGRCWGLETGDWRLLISRYAGNQPAAPPVKFQEARWSDGARTTPWPNSESA